MLWNRPEKLLKEKQSPLCPPGLRSGGAAPRCLRASAGSRGRCLFPLFPLDTPSGRLRMIPNVAGALPSTSIWFFRPRSLP